MKFILNISGGAYFKVLRPDSEIVYTLGREFQIDESGGIVTLEDYKLLDEIHLFPPYDEPLRINEHGEVRVLHENIWVTLAVITVVSFEHPELLEDLGDGYYLETPGSGLPVEGVAGVAPFEDVVVYYTPEAGKKERQIAVLNKRKFGRINDFITKMRGISLNMSLHTDLYPSPKPSLTTFNANIQALENAEAATETRTRGSVQVRNQAYDLVLDNVHGLLNYVQNLADNADDADDAITLIISSGFDLKDKRTFSKDVLEARHGKVSGEILLIAKAVKRAGAYEWQMSYDQVEWSLLPSTIEANTKVRELTPGSVVYFRCRAVTREGIGNWTQIVSIIVN